MCSIFIINRVGDDVINVAITRNSYNPLSKHNLGKQIENNKTNTNTVVKETGCIIDSYQEILPTGGYHGCQLGLHRSAG